MAKIIIDSVEYDSDELSTEALAQVQSIQFVDSEVTRLTGKIAAMNTARIAYSSALRSCWPTSRIVKARLTPDRRPVAGKQT